jgi:flagellar P-ring protein precursor FlgI
MKTPFTFALAILAVLASAQTATTTSSPDKEKAAQEAAKKAQEEQLQRILDGERNGIEVRIKDIARFRGIRSNQLLGYGLVVGLEGTGDTRNTPFTQTLLANAMKFAGTVVDPVFLKVKNVAVVAVTADLPPFSMPGNTIDVTVQSIGDAKSLQGGTLLQAPLFAATHDIVYAVAQGPISIGGFNVGVSGNSVQKNHSNVGRIPGGAIVENSVPTKVVFDGKLYLELDSADLTTAQRMAAKLNDTLPDYSASALTAGTIELTLPSGKTPTLAMSEIEAIKVFADVPAVVVINERTGTIVVGGNVRVGPAMIAKGSLSVRIETYYEVSQPAPFSRRGDTVVVPQTRVDAQESNAQVALIAPTTTVADLARLFQTLKVSPTDIIAILQALQEQGALKARIKVQ